MELNMVVQLVEVKDCFLIILAKIFISNKNRFLFLIKLWYEKLNTWGKPGLGGPYLLGDSAYSAMGNPPIILATLEPLPTSFSCNPLPSPPSWSSLLQLPSLVSSLWSSIGDDFPVLPLLLCTWINGSLLFSTVTVLCNPLSKSGSLFSKSSLKPKNILSNNEIFQIWIYLIIIKFILCQLSPISSKTTSSPPAVTAIGLPFEPCCSPGGVSGGGDSIGGGDGDAWIGILVDILLSLVGGECCTGKEDCNKAGETLSLESLRRFELVCK